MLGFDLMVLLDACIAMIPKTDGDATPLARGLSVFSPSSTAFGLLLVWVSFGLGCLIRSLVLVEVVGRWKLGTLLLWVLRKFLLVPLSLLLGGPWTRDGSVPQGCVLSWVGGGRMVG